MEDSTQIIATEQKKEVTTSNKVTDYSLGIFGTSDNFIMAMQMAKALAESTIVPQTYQKNPSNCLIAIEQAQRMRISPLMVMQNLCSLDFKCKLMELKQIKCADVSFEFRNGKRHEKCPLEKIEMQ